MKRIMVADPDEDPIGRLKRLAFEMGAQTRKYHDESRKRHNDVMAEIRETQEKIKELLRQAEERRKKSS